MILSVSEFLPTGWARVGIPKGITETLAAEDVAAFSWYNQSSALHNLRVAIHANRTANGTRWLRTCSFIFQWSQFSRHFICHIHIIISRFIFIIATQHTAVRLPLASESQISPLSLILFNNHNRIVVSEINDYRIRRFTCEVYYFFTSLKTER